LPMIYLFILLFVFTFIPGTWSESLPSACQQCQRAFR